MKTLESVIWVLEWSLYEMDIDSEKLLIKIKSYTR